MEHLAASLTGSPAGDGPPAPGGGSGVVCRSLLRRMVPGLRSRGLTRYLVSVFLMLTLMVIFMLITSQHVQDVLPYSDKENNERIPRQQMLATHRMRAQRVREVCNSTASLGVHNTGGNEELVGNRLRHIYVDDNHRFLYCSVPKVACTNFKRVLLVLSGQLNVSKSADLLAADVHGSLENKLSTLNEYTPEEVSFRLRTYYKFMFVRNPLERLLSAYVNKFTVSYNSYFQERYGRRIVKYYRDHPSKMALLKGHDVTFSEFVRFLLDGSRSEPFNEHWQQYYKLCLPCLVQYDAIGKYETMASDIDFVLGEIGVKDLVSFPGGQGQQGKGKTTDISNIYYRNITSDQLYRLWELFYLDFSMFDYPFPEVKGST